MLKERLTQFPPSFNVERFMADLTSDVRISCLACGGYGIDRSTGTAQLCEGCEGLGRIHPLCVDATCRHPKCIANRAMALMIMRSAVA